MKKSANDKINKYEINGISIIVPAKNEEKYIRLCVESLIRQNFSGPFEIIIVDNNSDDKTFQIICEYKDLLVIKSYGPSPSAVRNLGAKIAKYNLLAFIDGDCSAPNDWIKKSFDYLKKNKNVGAYGGPCLIPFDANWIVKAWAPHNNLKRIKNSHSLPGANLILKRNVFEAVGGFNESLITAEDDEICQKIRQLGFEVINDGSNAVTHFGYPNTIMGIFSKAIWHGSTQIKALRIWENKILLLTIIWFLSLIISCFFVIFDSDFFYYSLANIFLIPAFLSFSRLKGLPFLQFIKFFLFTYIISVFVFCGRSIGLVKEIFKIFFPKYSR